MRTVITADLSAPVPYDFKKFAGKWRFIGPTGETEADFFVNAEQYRLESRLKECTRRMQYTKNRFKREMYRNRADAARTQLSALLLSK